MMRGWKGARLEVNVDESLAAFVKGIENAK